MLPFYERFGLPVKAVLTDNGREFCGTETIPTSSTSPSRASSTAGPACAHPAPGFVERFNGTVLDEFFRVKMRDAFYDRVEALQADLDTWLVHYDTERPHLGYRNQGRRPIETINQSVNQEG